MDNTKLCILLTLFFCLVLLFVYQVISNADQQKCSSSSSFSFVSSKNKNNNIRPSGNGEPHVYLLSSTAKTTNNADDNENLLPPFQGDFEIKRPCGLPLQKDKEEPTQCPDEELYLALWLLVRKPSTWTIVDVGSNKGYSIASFLESFNVSSDDSSSSSSSSSPLSRHGLGIDLFRNAKKLQVPKQSAHSLCGACCECCNHRKSAWKEPPLVNHPWTTRRKKDVSINSLDVYMFDGAKSHVDYVDQFFNVNKNYHQKAKNISFHSFQKMVTAPEIVKHDKKPTFCEQRHFGSEGSHILNMEKDRCKPHESKVSVDAITLDDFLSKKKVNFIDILLSDTEGHDFDVLAGAREKFLKPGRVGIYIFEIHRGPNPRGVHSVVSELETYGFVCYYPLQRKFSQMNQQESRIDRHVVRISGNCWLREYEQNRGWMNIVCANERRFPELAHVFMELENLPKNHRWKSCDMKEVEKGFLSQFSEDDKSKLGLDTRWMMY